MIVKDVTVQYDDCEICHASNCISSYQPRTFTSIERMLRAITKTCTKCNKPLGIKSIRAKLVSKE